MLNNIIQVNDFYNTLTVFTHFSFFSVTVFSDTGEYTTDAHIKLNINQKSVPLASLVFIEVYTIQKCTCTQSYEEGSFTLVVINRLLGPRHFAEAHIKTHYAKSIFGPISVQRVLSSVRTLHCSHTRTPTQNRVSESSCVTEFTVLEILHIEDYWFLHTVCSFDCSSLV